jgi:hypothetical protein
MRSGGERGSWSVTLGGMGKGGWESNCTSSFRGLCIANTCHLMLSPHVLACLPFFVIYWLLVQIRTSRAQKVIISRYLIDEIVSVAFNF